MTTLVLKSSEIECFLKLFLHQNLKNVRKKFINSKAGTGAGVGTAQKIGGYATLPRPKGAVNRKNDKLFSFRCYAS